MELGHTIKTVLRVQKLQKHPEVNSFQGNKIQPLTTSHSKRIELINIKLVVNV